MVVGKEENDMALFLSTYTNKLDKKGRVSIPAPFRSVLSAENFNGVIVYPSFVYECVEACGMNRIEKLSESIDSMDPFSDERDAFAATILGGSVQLQFDDGGRVLLPSQLIEQAGLSDAAVFIGKGQTFEIWSPERFKEYSEKARDMAKAKRASLSLMPRGDK